MRQLPLAYQLSLSLVQLLVVTPFFYLSAHHSVCLFVMVSISLIMSMISPYVRVCDVCVCIRERILRRVNCMVLVFSYIESIQYMLI